METMTLAESPYEIERNKPMPSLNHSIVQSDLIFYLKSKYRKLYSFLSEIRIAMKPNDLVPDIGIYPPKKLQPGRDEIRMEDAPLGVIEILSPTQDLTSLISKSYQYFQKGAKSYWLVLPDLRSIYVFNEPGEYENFTYRDVLRDEKLGIELDLSEVFGGD